jgi:Na+/alanine symporter
MFVLEKGLKQKWLGITIAVLEVIVSFGIGNMVQANSISHLLSDQFGISPIITGIVLTIVPGIVILGGIRSIARVCEMSVPVMAILYVIFSFFWFDYYFEIFWSFSYVTNVSMSIANLINIFYSWIILSKNFNNFCNFFKRIFDFYS